MLNFSEAILNPGAFDLLEMTIEGITFLIMRLCIADKIAAILLPLPEISIARFINAYLINYVFLICILKPADPI
jgi:hypothetical protein